MADGDAFCGQCGEPMAADDAFCGKCGATVERPVVSGDACPVCGGVIGQAGRYCHHCGAELGAAADVEEIEWHEAAAFCPNCAQPFPLNGRHKFCPRDGEPIHLFVEVDTREMFMHDVRKKIAFRLTSNVDEEVRVHSFQAHSGGTALAKGFMRLMEGGHTLTPQSPAATIHRYFEPKKGECPAGEGPLDIALEFEAGGGRYRLEGGIEIYVLPENPSASQLTSYVNYHVQQTGEGPQAGGAHSVNIRPEMSAKQAESEAQQFINNLRETRGENFRPVGMRLIVIEAPEPKDSIAIEAGPDLPPAPDWDIHDKSTLSFTLGGVEYLYGLISTYPIRLGRDSDACDVRFYEVERCVERMRQQEAAGVPAEDIRSQSRVSKVQWELRGEGTRLRVINCSKRGNSILATGRLLEAYEEHILELGEGIRVPEAAGIRLGAVSGRDDRLEGLRLEAAEILRKPEEKLPFWPYHAGGHRIDRFGSLDGNEIEGCPRIDVIERYIMFLGWASLGSSEEACIAVPDDSLAPHHAYLLLVDGYVFVRPLDGHPLRVDGQSITRMHPLRPGATIQAGEVELTFGPFRQVGVFL